MLAGGTAALLAGHGHYVTMATMTAGDCGSKDYGPEEIAAIRQKEAAASAKMIGAEYVCAGFKDMGVFNDDASRRKVTELMRSMRPDVVITASPIDYHCDHEATSVLVRDACFCLGAPNYRTGPAEPLTWIPHLYFADSVEGVDRNGQPVQPDFMVDVEAQMDTKRSMLACHASQREWLRKHHGMDDYIENMVRFSAAQGARFGLRYGEGFRHYTIHPYPQTPLLEELIGDAVTVRRGA